MSKTFIFFAVCLAVLLVSVQVSKQNIRVMPRKNTWNVFSVEFSNIVLAQQSIHTVYPSLKADGFEKLFY